MSSAIMRFKKLHTIEEIGHALGHNKRIRNVKNADKERECLNTSITYVDDIKKHVKGLDKVHKKTTGKRARKDAVRIIEVIMTSDKNFFERVNDSEYFEACRKWLVEVFGEENILSMDIHRDERTPHVHFLVVPMKDGKYACKQIINGRNAVRGLQNSFFEAVKDFGLERGELVEYTNAKHKSSLQFAEDVQNGKETVIEMNERERESYAIYGAMAKEEIKELKEENKKLKVERDMYKEQFESLCVGVGSLIKGDRKHKEENLRSMIAQGRQIRKSISKEQEKENEIEI